VSRRFLVAKLKISRHRQPGGREARHKVMRPWRAVILCSAAIAVSACAVTSVAPSPTPRRAASTHAPTSAPVPVVATAAVRASAHVGYLFRQAPGVELPSLLRSEDGGAHFHAVAVPRLVTSVTFVDPTDGYAVMRRGPHVQDLVTTTNGARSWAVVGSPVAGTVIAVSGHGRRVFALTGQCSNRYEWRHIELYTSAAGSRHWRRASETGAPPSLRQGNVQLTAYGDTVWLTTLVAGRPTVSVSTNGGRSFATTRQISAISCGSSASDDRTLWLSCSTGMLTAFYRVTGRALHLRKLPVTGAGTLNTFVDVVGGTAYFGTAGGAKAGLYRSHDGAAFTKVTDWPAAFGSSRPVAITFLNRDDGVAVVAGKPAVHTTDGGRTWTEPTITG
jgi:photosystem II stability/assembly factor-like uncharacterized protein